MGQIEQAVCKQMTFLIQLIQFSISTDFVYTQSNVKTTLYQTIQFSVSRVSMSKTVPFQTIQFSISSPFKCKYTVCLSKTFLFQAIQFSQTVVIQTIQFIHLDVFVSDYHCHMESSRHLFFLHGYRLDSRHQ